MNEEFDNESSDEFRKDIVRKWFLDRYENPANCLPYESREGGYIYIWGGPYNPRDILELKFYGKVNNDILEQVINEFEDETPEWSGKSTSELFENYLLGPITPNELKFMNFVDCMEDIRRLVDIKIDIESKVRLNRLLYVNVIAAIEVYLSETFINVVSRDDKYIRKYIKTCRHFIKQSINVNDIFDRLDTINGEAIKHLSEILWHNIVNDKALYHDVLGVSFSKETGDIIRAVLKRHDIVHRNGKSSNGENVIITGEDVVILINTATNFINHINEQLREI